MTNQEAIIKLTNIMHDDHYSWHPSILTAFGMAVDALKGEGDCISRAEAIDAMTTTLWHYPTECLRNINNYEFAKGLAELGLKSVPSAQPEGWLEQNKAKILQAGMEGREIDFRIGGRLFAIREKSTMMEMIERQTVIDTRRYTFGNDEFSLEAAYHDCKLVFDGITDDDSFQEADTGLILYYANEIIYALQEALEGKDTNIPTNDCISRAEAIDAVGSMLRRKFGIGGDLAEITLAGLPSAQPERVWHPVEKPPAHHKDVIVRGVEAIGNVTVHKVMQWDVDTWRPTDYAPSIMWTEWSEI